MVEGLQTFLIKFHLHSEFPDLIILLNPRRNQDFVPHVLHPMLREGVEARGYQIRALQKALSSSTLMVMPTGFGKTAVEWMVMAEFLNRGVGKIILIAPTTGLVDQQRSMAQEHLNIDAESIVAYTGETPPGRRAELWASSTVLMATPQVIRNDAMNGVIDLSEVGLLIVDEAHHATGNHAYAQVGQLYHQHQPQPHVLAATASPGATFSQITEVKSNLRTFTLDLCKRNEPLLARFDVDMNIQTHEVDLPETLLDLIKPLQAHFQREVEHLQQQGFLAPKSYIGTRDIEKAQLRASRAVQQRDVRGYDAARRVADLRRIHMLTNLLQTQGTSVAKAFLDRAEREGRDGRKTNRMLSLPVIHEIRLALNDIDELHPKAPLARQLIVDELTDKPQGKVLIFTEFRDTVQELVHGLSGIEGVHADVFIGQSSRGGQRGMTQKEQLRQLQRFRQGEINVLVATSVGEEGLDVPAADLVVLYEPVPSAVRAIQRRGRTARQRAGSVHVLLATQTRDTYIQRASERQEQNMHELLKKMVGQHSLSDTTDLDPNALQSFSIDDDGTVLTAEAFLAREIAMHPTPEQEVQEHLPTPQRSTRLRTDTVAPPLTPSQLRGAHSKTLYSYENKTTPPLSSKELNVVMDATVREMESFNTLKGSRTTVLIDRREGNSTLPGYLNGLGFRTEFTHLPIGDIRLSERMLIERKSSRDILASIKDGRLLAQCRTLKAHAARPLLLVEVGDNGQYGLHPNAVLGAMAHVTLDLGVPVMMVKDAMEAAHFVGIAAQREHAALAQMTGLFEQTSSTDEEMAQACSAAAAELATIIDNPSSPHPWFDSKVEQLADLFTTTVNAMLGDRPDMLRLAMAFSPSLASLFTANAAAVQEHTTCSAEEAAELEAWLKNQ